MSKITVKGTTETNIYPELYITDAIINHYDKRIIDVKIDKQKNYLDLKIKDFDRDEFINLCSRKDIMHARNSGTPLMSIQFRYNNHVFDVYYNAKRIDGKIVANTVEISETKNNNNSNNFDIRLQYSYDINCEEINDIVLKKESKIYIKQITTSRELGLFVGYIRVLDLPFHLWLDKDTFCTKFDVDILKQRYEIEFDKDLLVETLKSIKDKFNSTRAKRSIMQALYNIIYCNRLDTNIKLIEPIQGITAYKVETKIDIFEPVNCYIVCTDKIFEKVRKTKNTARKVINTYSNYINHYFIRKSDILKIENLTTEIIEKDKEFFSELFKLMFATYESIYNASNRKKIIQSNQHNLAKTYKIIVYTSNMFTETFSSLDDLLEFIENNYIILYKDDEKTVSNICISTKEYKDGIKTATDSYNDLFKYIFVNKNILRIINKKLPHIHINDESQLNFVKIVAKLITDIEAAVIAISENYDLFDYKRGADNIKFEILGIDEDTRIKYFIKNWDNIKTYSNFYTSYFITRILSSAARIKFLKEKYKNIVENSNFKSLWYSLMFQEGMEQFKGALYIYNFEKFVDELNKKQFAHIFNYTTCLSLDNNEIKIKIGKETYKKMIDDISKIISELINEYYKRVSKRIK